VVDRSPGEREKDYARLTGGRHNAAYYARLGEVKYVAAFGGIFYPAWVRQIRSKINGAAKRVIVDMLDWPTRTIVQADSWRFWEALAAGSLVIHADLSRFGVIFPESPVNGIHYFGFPPGILVDHSRFAKLSDSAASEIAGHGQEWALQRYSPRATAERLLDYLTNAKSS
jgi:hypothetical protein